MPVHDWMKVDAGIYHAFHHHWISAISDFLNGGNLPSDYYALPEQVAGGFGPDVLTLQGQSGDDDAFTKKSGETTTLLRSRPRTRFTASSEGPFQRRRKSSIVIRHVSGDRVVAMLEIVSPGNKSNRHAMRAFVDKACELLELGVHLLIIDPFPPGPRDPQGIHAAIWEQVQENIYTPPADEPLTLVAYECGEITRAYIEPLAVGKPLPEMPLFLEPEGCIMVPLETTYQSAFEVMPARWRKVLAPPE